MNESKNNTIQSNNINNKSLNTLESLIPIDSEYENYEIKATICNRLARELNLQEKKYNIIDYKPPDFPGLMNSDVIIPSYYKLDKHPSKILEIDYFIIIKDDIRNFRPLNKYQLEYIKKLSHEDKNELFNIYNDCTKAIKDII